MEPNPVAIGICLAQSVGGRDVLSREHVLGQRRTLIRQMRLVADQVDRAIESSLAHRNDRGSRRLPRADDDNAAGLYRHGRRRLGSTCFGDRAARQIGIDENVIALDSDRECPDIPCQRRAERLAGADVEHALVQRALDLTVLDKSFAKKRERMRAYAMRCVNIAFKTIERKRESVELHADHPALRNRMKRSCALPCHGRRPSTVPRPYARERETRSHLA